MKCWHCNTELEWCGDVDISEESENYAIETMLYCSKCDSETLVYLSKEKEKVDAKIKKANRTSRTK